MKKDSRNIFFWSILYFTIIILQVTATAGDLGGRYFPEDSPFLPNYSPNDFLPWGTVLLVGVAWLFVKSLMNVKKKIYRDAALLFFSLLGLLLTFYLRRRLGSIYGWNTDHWSYLLSQLIDAWGLCWTWGFLWAYNVRSIDEKEKVIDS